MKFRDLPLISALTRNRGKRQSNRRASQARAYKAAAHNRLTGDWTTVNQSARYETYRSLRRLRARSRHLAHNSDHFKKFLSMVRNNVAGPAGMTLQVMGPNDDQNQAIEKAFKTWSHKEHASVNGRLSFPMQLRLLATTLARDGEVLIRQVFDVGRFGYALKFISVNWLDENHNETLPNGNRIIMGVEIDTNDKPVQFWLTPPAESYPGGRVPFPRKRTAIPADEIFHLFLPDDENADDDTQTRGVPWAHTAMLRLHNLELYEEAALYNARAGASKMGFFSPPDDSEESTGEGDEEERGAKPLVENFEPGTFWELPPGYEFHPWDPTYPSQEHDGFVKAMLRSAASGLDVAYCSLANDLEGVNFSSIRAGLVEEREIWKALQNFVIESFCRPVFINWLREATFAGLVPVRAREFEIFTEPVFQPRRWSWVDPLKDIQAKRLAIGAGLDTITDTLAEMAGGTLEDTFRKRKRELDLAKQEGIPLATEIGATASATDDDEDEPTPEKKKTKPVKK